MPPPLDLRPRRGAVAMLASSKWTVSAAAAAVVLAILAGVLAVAGALPARQPLPTGPIQTTVPPYYVALVTSQPGPQRYWVAAQATIAAVRATSTGAVVATVTAPQPYAFVSVTGATDDRTFVLYAVGPSTMTSKPPYYGIYAQRFFMLRIDPAAAAPAARAQLTALPQARIAGELQVEAMALSPNSKSLAVILTDPSRAVRTNVPGQLTIFNLADGGRRTWIREFCAYGRCAQGPIGLGSIFIDPSEVQLSWTSDGRSLLFLTGPAGSQLRLLDVDSTGRNLIADSHALPGRTAYPNWTDAVITPDGSSVFIVYSTMSGDAVGRNFFVRVSASTGKTAAVIQVRRDAHNTDYLLWTNDNASRFIVFRGGPAIPGEVIPSGQTAGIYSGRRYTPIPWPTGVIDAAW